MENTKSNECEANASSEKSSRQKIPWWRMPLMLWRRRLAMQENNTLCTEGKVRNRQSEFKYSKRAGTSGVCGQLYETKLLCLVLLRALNNTMIEHFLLGTNIHGIGDMDDICLRYRVRDRERPIMLFVQAKHREDREKRKLTDDDVRSASGGFSLRKYFESYLTIKERFRADNEDPMFKGDFRDVECNLIIYTPVKDCFTKKITELKVNETVNYLLNTGNFTDIFKYDYDEDDIENLTKITVLERLKKLGAVFLDFIMSKKDKSENILMDKLIATYHVVMGREVLQKCKIQPTNKEFRMWEFRPQFFESNCEYLEALKMTFVHELSTKRWDQSKITDEDLENYMISIKNPCAAAFSKLIGKIILYNDKAKKLQLVEMTILRKNIKTNEFKALLDQFNGIETNENIISKAIEIRLLSIKIKLPLAFGNLDMTFRGSETKVQRRMKAVADKLTHLFEINKHTHIDINDDVVGPGKTIEQGVIDINGGIGGAVGNLLVLDPVTKLLKFDLDNEALPSNSALFLKVLKENSHMTGNEKLSSYRIRININGFPKDTFDGDEYDKRQAKDFFSTLLFYTNQAKENEIESNIKDDIKYYHERCGSQFKFKIYPDAIFLRAHDGIQKWWMQSGKAAYLTRSNDFFLQATFAIHGERRLVNRRYSSCHT